MIEIQSAASAPSKKSLRSVKSKIEEIFPSQLIGLLGLGGSGTLIARGSSDLMIINTILEVDLNKIINNFFGGNSQLVNVLLEKNILYIK